MTLFDREATATSTEDMCPGAIPILLASGGVSWRTERPPSLPPIAGPNHHASQACSRPKAGSGHAAWWILARPQHISRLLPGRRLDLRVPKAVPFGAQRRFTLDAKRRFHRAAQADNQHSLLLQWPPAFISSKNNHVNFSSHIDSATSRSTYRQGARTQASGSDPGALST